MTTRIRYTDDDNRTPEQIEADELVCAEVEATGGTLSEMTPKQRAALSVRAHERKRAAEARAPKLPSRRWGPFRQEFYSICSCHQANDLACTSCGMGQWVNVWRQRIGHFVFGRWPRLWCRWANFPSPKLKLEQRDKDLT